MKNLDHHIIRGYFLIVILLISVFALPQSSQLPGKAIQFGSSGEYISGSCVNSGLTAVTLEAWVYHESLSTTVQRYITLGSEVAVIRHNSSSPGQLHFYVKKADGNLVSITANDVLSTYTWTHVAGTYDGISLKLYCNGVLVASSSPAAPLYSNNGLFDISSGSEYMQGKLDELRVWNYARTQQQIRENIHLPLSGSESGLIHYWQLNEGSGTTITDIVNSCTGTLHNLVNGNWVESTIPLGGGTSNSQTVSSTGNVIFSGTGLSADFTDISGAESITVSRINLAPNTKPSDDFYASASQYWVIRNFNSQTFSADLTFSLNDDLNSYNFENPGSVRLFARSENYDGAWILVSGASVVDTTSNLATFAGISTFGQFLVLRTFPVNYAGNALDFDGINDYLELANGSGFQYNNSFTVEAWVKTGTMESGFHSVLAKGTEWELKMYEGSSFIVVEFGINNNAIFSVKNLSTSLVTGKWVHLAGVVNQTAGQKNLVLYVNGEAGSPETPASITPSAALIKAGNNFTGVIDEIKIWRVARTQQQIRENMHLTPTSADKHLEVCLQFNESNGTTANDVAGGNNGTLSNMTSSDWIASGAPVGGGISHTQTEAAGTVNFTGTGLSMYYNSHGSASVTVTRIDTASNNNASFFDSQFWIIHRYGSGSFNANLAFTTQEDLNAEDQTSPFQIKAYSRSSNDDGLWSYAHQAATVDAAGNTATFNGFTSFSQLVLGRRLPADNSSGNALIFNHNNDYVSASGIESTMRQFTLEAWVLHNALTTELQQYISIEPNTASILYDGLNPSYPNQLAFEIQDSDYHGFSLRADNALTAQTWMHIAASYDGDTMKLYRDGNLLGTMIPSVAVSPPVGNYYISAPNNEILGPVAMNGKMDEVRIWNYERNIADIRADMYRTLSGTETGLVSYWQFNEGSGIAPKDIVGGNTGTFHNMDAGNWTISTIPTPYQSIADGNWSNSSSWDAGQGVPDKDWSRVMVNDNIILDQDETTTDLTIDATASLVVASTSHLTVSGDLLNNAGNTGLWLKSDAAATASLIHETANVDGSVERYIPQYVGAAGWHLLSSPVDAQAIRPEFVNFGTPNPDNDFFKFDEPTYYWINTKLVSGEWNTAFEDLFVLGKGYLTAYKTNVTKSFQGKLNTGNFTFNGTSTPAITYTESTGKGWNLLGNPFPSALDWDEFTKTNITGSVYVYDGAAGQYISWNGTTGSLTDGIIPPMNGFFIKAANGASLTIPNTSRKHTSLNFYKNRSLVENLLVLKVVGNGFSDKTYIHFREEATIGLDNDFDAYKLLGIEEAPQLYTFVDEKKLSINSLPFVNEVISIPLNLKVGSEGMYKISVAENSFWETVGVSLKDLMTGIVYDLRQQASITVNHSPENQRERFLLLVNGATSVSEISDDDDGIEIYSFNHQIFVKSEKSEIVQISVYNLLGQNLISGNLSGFQNLTGLPIQIDFTGNTGFYLVKVKTENSTKFKKIYIR